LFVWSKGPDTRGMRGLSGETRAGGTGPARPRPPPSNEPPPPNKSPCSPKSKPAPTPPPHTHRTGPLPRTSPPLPLPPPTRTARPRGRPGCRLSFRERPRRSSWCARSCQGGGGVWGGLVQSGKTLCGDCGCARSWRGLGGGLFGVFQLGRCGHVSPPCRSRTAPSQKQKPNRSPPKKQLPGVLTHRPARFLPLVAKGKRAPTLKKTQKFARGWLTAHP
jgi:hypothetical protein